MKTVVIMEDDRRIAGHWASLLEAAGYRVVAETHAEAAAETVHRTGADLVIADLLVKSTEPGIAQRGGMSLINDLTSLRPPPKRPIILAITGMPQKDRLENYLMSLGADRLLTKPVPPAELVRVVQACLGDPVNATSEASAEAS